MRRRDAFPAASLLLLQLLLMYDVSVASGDLPCDLPCVTPPAGQLTSKA